MGTAIIQNQEKLWNIHRMTSTSATQIRCVLKIVQQVYMMVDLQAIQLD